MYATKSLNNITNIHVEAMAEYCTRQWYNFVKTADRMRQRLVREVGPIEHKRWRKKNSWHGEVQYEDKNKQGYHNKWSLEIIVVDWRSRWEIAVNEVKPNDDYGILTGEGNKNKRLRGLGISTSTRTSLPSTIEIWVRFSFVEGMGMRS